METFQMIQCFYFYLFKELLITRIYYFENSECLIESEINHKLEDKGFYILIFI